MAMRMEEGAPPRAERTEPAARTVTPRAIALACALMPALALWTVKSGMIRYAGHSTTISLFFHVLIVVFALAAINVALRRRAPRLAFSTGELMTVYVMLAIAGTLCSTDFIQVLIPMMGFPHYNANPLNNWASTLLPHIPEWAVVNGPPEALNGLAVGNASFFADGIWQAWVGPLLFWAVFVLALLGALLAINLLFRRQWVEKERLSFPVVQVPMIIAARTEELFRSGLFWLAFAVTAAINLLNGFQHFHPTLPRFPTMNAFSFSDYFVERPWNAIANTQVHFFPFVIGITFFIPTDLAFSCWFFFLFFKAQLVLTSAAGIHDLPGFPFPMEQAAGGYLAIALLAIWTSRRHLSGAFRTALGLPGGADDTGEPMRYRWMAVLLAVCTATLLAQGWMLGFTWPVGVAFFILFFLYAIAIARMRAELGPPAHDLHYMGPDILIQNALGTRALGPDTLGGLSMTYWFNRAYRAHFSAHSMEAFKLAQWTAIPARRMMAVIGIAVVVGLVSAFWATLHTLYTHGYSGRPAGDAFAGEAWNRMASLMAFPQDPRLAATGATAGGVAFALLLGALRMRLVWWPFHPVGYATASSWSMERLWFCIFIGWLAKSLIVRYGGAQAYRRALPFFVGLILGEFTVASAWSVFGMVADVDVYHFWG